MQSPPQRIPFLQKLLWTLAASVTAAALAAGVMAARVTSRSLQRETALRAQGVASAVAALGVPGGADPLRLAAALGRASKGSGARRIEILRWEEERFRVVASSDPTVRSGQVSWSRPTRLAWCTSLRDVACDSNSNSHCR